MDATTTRHPRTPRLLRRRLLRELRHRPGRLRLALALALAVGVATSGASAVVVSLAPTQAAAAGGTAAPCPVGTSDGQGGCEVHLPCLAQYVGCDPVNPPSVDVAPESSLLDGQYVTVRTTNFPTAFTDGATTGDLRVALCSTRTTTTNPLCLSGQWEASATAYGPVKEPVSSLTSDHATQLSYPVFLDEPGAGQSSLPAQLIDPGVFPPKNKGIYCDDVGDGCALDVTIEEGTGTDTNPEITSTNSAVMPLSFAPAVAGCPAADAQLHSESSYSVFQYLEAAVGETCAGASGVIDLNTPTDTTSVAKEFAAGDYADGGIDLGFVDNPSDPAEEGALLGGRGFAYVPVAVSATTPAFLATRSADGGALQLLTSYRLTPTMLAGLTNSAYQTPTGSYSGPTLSKTGLFYSDNLLAALNAATTDGSPTPLDCDELVDCSPPPGLKKVSKAQQLLDEENVDAFDLLNPKSAGIRGPQTFGSFMPDAPSGAVTQATGWICDQPASPLTLDLAEVGVAGTTPVTVTDTNLAPPLLVGQPPSTNVTGLEWNWPTADCTAQSTLPAVPVGNGQSGSSVQFAQYESPELQANQVRSYILAGGQVPPGGANQPAAGFALMDSSEADYYGLNAASVQDASGNFESPTTQSVEDALSTMASCTATTTSLSCPAGTYGPVGSLPAPSGTPPVTDAYPMTDVTYALIPTGAQPADQAAAMKHLLTNLVDFSSASNAGSLPPGYFPLSAAMRTSALAAIDTDILSEPAAPTPGTVPPASRTVPAAISGTPAADGSARGAASSLLAPTEALDTLADTGAGPASADQPAVDAAARSRGSSGGEGGSAAVAGPALLVSLDGADRFLLPALVVLALGGLVGGTLLLVDPDRLRRLRRTRRAR